jgi:quercetin dioxygenase-like cupin family protein
MTGSATLPALVRVAGEGPRRWFYGGGVHTWLATGEETGGAFLLFEDAMDAGKRTPLHTHPDADETMYVLQGEILVHLDGAEERIGAGGLILAPRGLPHAFMVTADDTRLLCLQTPGCCQSFYFGASEPLTPETSRVVDFDRVRTSGAANGGIEILGPPPFPPSSTR